VASRPCGSCINTWLLHQEIYIGLSFRSIRRICAAIDFICTMNLKDFKSTISSGSIPDGLSKPLLAMWYDGTGNWNQAHEIAQDIQSTEGSWIHAYLHRKEGDQGNAGYWYHRANRPVCNTSLQAEWEHIVTALLDHSYPDVHGS
jgi:hypothetical protein